jgi:hypothetical protein
MHLVTRRSEPGRGAAGMLIDWSIERSDRSGVPAYLEAGAQSRPLYAKYDFEQVGDLRQLDLRLLVSMLALNWQIGCGDRRVSKHRRHSAALHREHLVS